MTKRNPKTKAARPGSDNRASMRFASLILRKTKDKTFRAKVANLRRRTGTRDVETLLRPFTI
jgi:hypothetical protein